MAAPPSSWSCRRIEATGIIFPSCHIVLCPSAGSLTIRESTERSSSVDLRFLDSMLSFSIRWISLADGAVTSLQDPMASAGPIRSEIVASAIR